MAEGSTLRCAPCRANRIEPHHATGTYALFHVIPRSESDEESVAPTRDGSFASLRMTRRNPGPGVLGGVAPPVPIPNTAVKRPSADDTRGVTFWENRPMPGPIIC